MRCATRCVRSVASWETLPDDGADRFLVVVQSGLHEGAELAGAVGGVRLLGELLDHPEAAVPTVGDF